MATLSISWTVPDASIAAIKDDFAAYNGWVSGGPETQNAFIKRTVGEFIKDSVKAQRMKVSLDSARLAVIADINSSVVLA